MVTSEENKSFDVMCVGEMLIDFTPGKETGSYIRNPGGAPANVAIAISRFGRSAAFCGKLGNDDFGRFLIKTLKNNNVGVLCSELTDEAVTTMAFVSISETGDRSFTFARKPGADMLLKTEDIQPANIQNAAVIHAGSCSLSKGTAREATKLAMKLGADAHKLVSFDLNYRDMMWDSEADAGEHINSVLPYVDLLKVSDDEIFLIGGEENVERIMKDANIAVVVVTRGGEGASAYFNDQVFDIPAMRAEIADTNGAGDAFWGGFVASVLNAGVRAADGMTDGLIKDALRFGTAAGWLTVQKHGAIPALPLKVQVEGVLNGSARGQVPAVQCRTAI